jgi:hypothetical protein
MMGLIMGLIMGLSGWCFGTLWMDYDIPEILGIVIIPTDELSYFSEGLTPPTRYVCMYVCMYVM